MATEILDLAKEGVSFLSSASDEEKLGISEISTCLDKLSKEVKDFIELRADIFLQKEEKIQQFQQVQLRKLEDEEQYYEEKYKAVEINLSDCQKQLKAVESSATHLKEKLVQEEELNEKLMIKMAKLEKEKKELRKQHCEGQSLYSRICYWYEKILNINIDISKENSKVVTFYFSNEKHESAPYVRFEVTDDFKFKILDTHADLDADKKNFGKLCTVQEVMSFIYDSQEKLKTMC